MRTLQIYSGNLYGGIENTLTVIGRDRANDATREFALCFDGRLSERLIASAAPVHFLGNVRVRRPWTVLRARRALRELLSRIRYDVVICHSAWSQAIFAPVVHQAGLPQVFWLHDFTKGRHWLDRWASRTRPDRVICNSAFTAGSVPSMYADMRVEVLHSPCAPLDMSDAASHRQAIRAQLGTPEDTTVVVQVSRFEPYKGHTLHLEALGLCADLAEPWECWVIGGVQRPQEARYLAELKRQAARLGVDTRVRFLGWQPKIVPFLAAADIHCQPNVGPEPFGVTFIEGLMARLPVVTTRMGGALEILDDSCGILVPPGDARALAQSLKQLIQDPPLRAKLGEAGPARATSLSDPPAQMRKLNRILTSVIEDRGRR